jgi:spore maturation protein SpmB
MTELEKLNPHPGTATNAMCTFLVLNTSALTLVSTSALLLLKSYKSTNPTAIVGPSILATLTGLVVGLVLARIFQRLPVFAARDAGASASGETVKPEAGEVPQAVDPPRFGAWQGVVLGLYAVVLAAAFGILLSRGGGPGGVSFQAILTAFSPLVLPGFIGFCVLYAGLAKLKVFDEFIEGAKEGMQTVFRIIPYLVAMLVAIGLLQASGVIEMLTRPLRTPLSWIGFPPELVPMALMRPLSGSGSLTVLANILETFGGDHVLSRMAATMYASSETTFYVLAVYFGAVGIRRIRHALLAGLIADAVAMGTAVFLCQLMFG